MVKFVVVVFLGMNCDFEIERVIWKVGVEVE